MRAEQQRVSVSDLTSSSATIRWPPQNHIPGVRMYQIQYNSSTDDILIYRYDLRDTGFKKNNLIWFEFRCRSNENSPFGSS